MLTIRREGDSPTLAVPPKVALVGERGNEGKKILDSDIRGRQKDIFLSAVQGGGNWGRGIAKSPRERWQGSLLNVQEASVDHHLRGKEGARDQKALDALNREGELPRHF